MSDLTKLRCFNPSTGKHDGGYCVWEGKGKCMKCEAADEIERLETHKDQCFDRMRTMQAEIERLQKRNALLEDVAVAAENMTYADAVAGAETWGEMKQVLDKLREMGDD